MKKIIIIAAIVILCSAGAVTAAIALGTRNAVENLPDTKILTELKVGRYYLEGGTDEQYIEVFDDRTICLYGYKPDEGVTEIQIENLKQYTTRRYYSLHDTVPFIGLSDEPDAPAIGVGYAYSDENTINFTAFIDGVHTQQKYIYK